MTTIIPNVYTKEKFILESIARINRKNASSLSITTIYTRNGTALITSWEEFVCKIEMISLINGVIQRRKGGKKREKTIISPVEASVSRMLDVGSSWFEVRDTKAGIRSAEKFISALLTGRKLNMPYWFSASRAPGETNRALCKQRARSQTHTGTCFDF